MPYKCIPMPEMSPRRVARFFAKTAIGVPPSHRPDLGPCRNWIGARMPKGYGRIQLGGKTFYSHRLAYFMAHGGIGNGLFVLHHCDNPSCVRGDHLYAGTQRENVEDCMAKGRRRKYGRQ